MPEPVKTFDNTMVVSGAFIYAGNTITFTAKKADVTPLAEGQVFEVNDHTKTGQLFTLTRTEKVSIGWLRVTGQRVPEELPEAPIQEEQNA